MKTRREGKRTEQPSSEEEEEEEVSVVRGQQNKRLRTNPSSASSSSATEVATLFTSTQPLKVDRPGKKAGAPHPPPAYSCSPKSIVAARSLPDADLRNVVSAATRLVLGLQLSDKLVTGKDVTGVISSKVQEDPTKTRLLLGYVRCEVSARLKDVFGFLLFAGQDEKEAKVTDKWYIKNGLENDALMRMTSEAAGGDEEEEEEMGVSSTDAADRQRGILMIVLASIMINRMEIAEPDLTKELTKFGFSTETAAKVKKAGGTEPSIPDVLAKLTKQSMVAKTKKDGVYVFRMGEKALAHVGKRAVLQWIIQTLKVDLDEPEEARLLRLQEDE